MKVTPEYLAGLIDGEGHVGIVVNNTTLDPRVTIHMCHKKTLHTVQKTFGGNLFPRKRLPPRHKQSWVLYWNGPKAVPILEVIQPFVITKKKQVALALEFWKFKRGSNQFRYAKNFQGRIIPKKNFLQRLTFKRRMHALNKRGEGLISLAQPRRHRRLRFLGGVSL